MICRYQEAAATAATASDQNDMATLRRAQATRLAQRLRVLETMQACTEQHAVLTDLLQRVETALQDGQLEIAKELTKAALQDIASKMSSRPELAYLHDRYGGNKHFTLADIFCSSAFLLFLRVVCVVLF